MPPLEAALDENCEYRIDFFRLIIQEARAEGRREGFAQGRRGGTLRALMSVLHARNMPVSPEARARIEAAPDADALLRILDRALFASTEEEALAEDGAPLAHCPSTVHARLPSPPNATSEERRLHAHPLQVALQPLVNIHKEEKQQIQTVHPVSAARHAPSLRQGQVGRPAQIPTSFPPALEPAP